MHVINPSYPPLITERKPYLGGNNNEQLCFPAQQGHPHFVFMKCVLFPIVLNGKLDRGTRKYPFFTSSQDVLHIELRHLNVTNLNFLKLN